MFRNVYYKIYKNFLNNFNKKNIKYKPLIKGLIKKTGGRNNLGTITSYHRGGGVKRLLRQVHFTYIDLLKQNMSNWIVERIEYDPNRNAYIMLLKTIFNLKFNLKNKKNFNYFLNNWYIYKLAHENIKKGDLISFFCQEKQDFAIKNQYSQLKNVLTGTEIYNIEIIKNTKGKLVRSAGCKAKLIRKYNKNALITLPSKEKKLISLQNFVSIGQVSNSLKLLKKKIIKQEILD